MEEPQRPAIDEDDEIRNYVLKKKLTLWERILKWVYR